MSSVPLRASIHGGLLEGHRIVINGVPTGGAGFKVSLLCGPSFDSDDIALCIDVRFNPGNNHVIINHKSGKAWGIEERPQTCCPFSENSPFEITILVEHSGFKISVNGKPYNEFKHRINCFHKVSQLHVDGNVRLTNVTL